MATVTLNCAADSILNQSTKTTNYGTSKFLSTMNSTTAARRSILRFDGVPTGIRQVTSAKLVLYVDTVGTIPSGQVWQVYGLTRSDWAEYSVNWNNRKTGSAWTTGGGDFDASTYGSLSLSTSYTSGDKIEIDITALLSKLIVTDGLTQLDLIFKTPENVSGTSTWLNVHSKETTTTSYKPTIELDYSTTVDYQDTADAASINVAGAQVSELADMGDSVSPSGITASGSVVNDAVGYFDGALPSGIVIGEVTVTDSASLSDAAQAASVALEGQSVSENLALEDVLEQANISLMGASASDLASSGDNAMPGLKSIAGQQVSELAQASDVMAPGTVDLHGSVAQSDITFFDNAAPSQLALAASDVADKQDALDDVSPSGISIKGQTQIDKAEYSDSAEVSTLSLKGSVVNEKTATPPSALPFSLTLYSTANGKPIAVLDEFVSFAFDKAKNEAGRVSISFREGHPANDLIRDIYTAEPHGCYGILYRRGEPFEGLILAETDITANPVQWSFLTFETKLRQHKTPGNWRALEGQEIGSAILSIVQYGYKWHQINDADAMQAAVAAGENVVYKTWHQLSGGSEGYNQPMVVLARSGGENKPYVANGSLTFSFDIGAAVQLERLRWQMATGEFNFIGVQVRHSTDGVNWTAWTPKEEITDADYAATYGLELSGIARYVEAKITLRTEDQTSKNPEGVKVGTTPVFHGLELVTRYATGLTAGNIDTNGEVLPSGYDFDHDNHFFVLASICEDFGYAFIVDHLNRVHVRRASGGEPYILRKGETTEPSVIAYTGLDEIENALTAYGAGEGLGRLSVQVEDAESIGIYGRRPGIVTEGKLTDYAELQSYAQEQLYEKAWPKLECQLRTPYQPGINALDARVGEFIAYIDNNAFTGSENTGYQLFEIKSEARIWDSNGEMVDFGLNSDLSNMFTAQSKLEVKRRYKKGRTLAQVPYNVRATGDFASVIVTWNGSAPEYSIEKATSAVGPFVTIGKTINTTYTATGLEVSTGYYFRIRALYGGAISGPSEVAYAETTKIDTSELDTTPPAIPKGLAGASATYVGAGGGIVIYNTLSWTANLEPDVAHYELRRRIQGGGGWQTVGIIPADMTSFVDTAGLQENTTYEYSIAATDRTNNRSDWSEIVAVATTKDATAPTLASTAPIVTSGFKRLVPRWTGSNDADLAYYKLQRMVADAAWDNLTGTWKVPSPVPADTAWENIEGSTILALQYHDTDVQFNKVYKYRVAAVDRSGNVSAYTNPSSWSCPSQLNTEDAAYRFITAEMYGEIRNVLPYTWRQEIDSSYPIEVNFYLPSETTNLVSIKLSAYGERFRATSKAAADGGSHHHSVSIPTHKHGILHGTVSSGVVTGPAGEHRHVAGDIDDAGGHTHDVDGGTNQVNDHVHGITGWTDSSGVHSHSSKQMSEAPGHQHSAWFMVAADLTESGGGAVVTADAVDSHTHGIVYGIYESTTPLGVKLYVDNGAGYGEAINLNAAPDSSTPYAIASELDITAYFSGTGWKKVKFTSSRLGSISGQLICKVDLTA